MAPRIEESAHADLLVFAECHGNRLRSGLQDQLYGGHWVPEMIDMAGGVNCFGDKDTGSFRLDWEAVVASQPEMIILMLCGYTAQRALEDVPILAAKPGWDDLPAVRHQQIFAMDASAYTSRSGPRLVQGLEIIAEILHPELFSGSIPEDSAIRVDSTLARIG